MSRLPGVNREALSPEDQAVWDRIAAVRPGMHGPYNALMYVPGLADRVATLENYFRFNAALPAADRELVILTTARESDAHFAWARHEPRGLEVGTRKEAIEAVRTNSDLAGLMPRERLLVQIVQSLLRTRHLSDELYTRGMAELGRQQLLETITLAGHYNLIGLVINGFDVTPPAGTPTF